MKKKIRKKAIESRSHMKQMELLAAGSSNNIKTRRIGNGFMNSNVVCNAVTTLFQVPTSFQNWCVNSLVTNVTCV